MYTFLGNSPHPGSRIYSFCHSFHVDPPSFVILGRQSRWVSFRWVFAEPRGFKTMHVYRIIEQLTVGFLLILASCPYLGNRIYAYLRHSPWPGQQNLYIFWYSLYLGSRVYAFHVIPINWGAESMHFVATTQYPISLMSSVAGRVLIANSIYPDPVEMMTYMA